MRVLVTGGAGFIGSHLVDRLIRERVGSIVVFDNLTRGRIQNLDLGRDSVEFVEGDVRDAAALKRVLQGTDLIFHLAAQASVVGAVADLDYSFSTNVVGTFQLLQAACEARVKRVVFTSSREVYGEPTSLPVREDAPLRPKNAYGASKASGEFYCRVFAERGLQTSVLRLTNVYGPRDFGRVIPIFVDNASRNEPLTLYGGDQVVDFIWIDRVTDALMEAGLRVSLDGPINIGSGRGTKIEELARRVIRTSGSNSSVLIVPSREMEVLRFVSDVAKARNLLSWADDGDPLAWLPDLFPRSSAGLPREVASGTLMARSVVVDHNGAA